MHTTTTPPSGQTSLAADVRRSFIPGLLAGGIQASIPLGLVLLGLLLSFSPLFYWATGFYVPLILLLRSFSYGLPLPSALFSLLVFGAPTLLFSTSVIDYVVSRRVAHATGRRRIGILACLWGNLGFLAASWMAIVLFQNVLARQYYLAYPLPSALFPQVLAEALSLEFGTLVIVSLIFASLGGKRGLQARRAPAPGGVSGAALETGDLAVVRDLATRGNLGAFVRVFTPLDFTTVLLRGLGLMVFFVVLLLVQRLVFNITGTEPAVTTITGVVASVGYMVQGARRRGQPIHLFQDGLIGLTQERRLIAMRWDEMQPLTTCSPLRVVSRTGEQIVVPDSLAHADELKDLIRQGVTRVAMAQR